jgi:hypothetical protein
VRGNRLYASGLIAGENDVDVSSSVLRATRDRKTGLPQM